MIHLDLEDLIGAANGQPVSAQDHLAGCEYCQAEAMRWQLVADGVRGRAAQPARNRRFPVAAAGVAAALVLIGTGAGVALTGSAPSAKAALTSVNGCRSLKQADGTLVRVGRASAVIKTASGQRVKVTTTTATRYAMFVPLSYVTNGTKVLASGRLSGRTITAEHVTVRPAFLGPLQVPKSYGAIRGTVTDKGAAGFTLVTAKGARFQVLTSGRTVVQVPPPHHVSKLLIGISTIAVGHVTAHGTLAAMGVMQLPPGWGNLRVGSCSPTSIDSAITTALASQ